MTYAISYIRFSHPSQRLGDSLRRQVERAEAYCREHSLVLNESIRDEGKSASSGAHVAVGALGRLLERVEAGEFEPGTVLIVEALDRLSRQKPLIALRQFLDILEKDITIVTLIDANRYDSVSANNNPLTLQFSLMQMVLAYGESEKKSDRGGQAWEKKRRDARATGKSMTGACPAWLSPASQRQPNGTFFIVHEARANTIRRVFEMVATENGGLMTVARKLNADTPVIRGRKGATGKWSQSTIRYFINSTAPEGISQPHKGSGATRTPIGEPMVGHFPRIVDADLVLRAREALQKRRNAGAGRKGKGVPNLLAGIACCGECNGSMGFVRGGRRSSPDYLMCYSANRAAGCTNRARFNYRRIEDAMLEEIGSLAYPPEEGTTDPARDLVRQLAEEKDKAAQADKRATRLAEVLAEDDGEPPHAVLQQIRQIERLKRECQDKCTQLEEEIASARAQIPTHERHEAAKLAIAKLRRDDLSEDDRYAVRIRMQGLLREIIDFVVCDPTEKSAMVIMAGAMMTFVIEHSGAVVQVGIHSNGQSVVRHPDGRWLGPMPSPPEVVVWQNAIKAKMGYRFRTFASRFWDKLGAARISPTPTT